MLDLETIGIGVDTSGVARARDELGRFVGSATKAAGAADKTASSMNAMDLAAKLSAMAVKSLVSAFSVWKIADTVRDMAMLAARFETMGVVMRVAGNNAGYTMSQMENFSKSLQKSGISMLESRNVLTQLATANIDLANAAKLGRAAQDVAVVGNINSSEALSRMVHGIKSGEVEILRTLGLNVSFEASYKKLALQLGTTSDKLSEQQKMLARTNAALEEASRYTGIYEEAMGTAGKQMTSLTRYWEDFKVKVGETFLPALTTTIMNQADAMKSWNAEMENLAQRGLIDDVATLLNDVLKIGLQTAAVLFSDLAFVVRGFGREIGGIVAQFSAMGEAGGVFSAKGRAAWVAVGKAITEDAENDRKALDAYQAKIMGLGETTKAAAKMSEQERIAAGRASRARAEAEEAALAAAKKKAEAMKEAQKAYEQAVKHSKDYIRSLKEEAEEVGLSKEQVAMLRAQREAAKAPTKALSDEIIRQAFNLTYLNIKQDEAKKAAEELEKANKALKEQAEEATKAYADQFDEIDKTTQGIKDQVQREQENIEAMGLTKAALTELMATRLEDRAASLERRAALMDEIDTTKALGDALREQADALRMLAGKTRDKGKKQEEIDVAEEAKKRSEALAQSIEDGIMNGFRGGKSFADIFINELKAQFAKTVLRPIIQPIAEAGSSLLSGVFKNFGGSILGLNSFDVGTDYVPHDQIALIHKGEKIIPAAQNKPGANSGRPTTVVVNQNFGPIGDVASMAMVRQAVANSERRIQSGIIRSITNGGELA